MRTFLPMLAGLFLMTSLGTFAASGGPDRGEERVAFRYNTGHFNRLDDIRWVERRDDDVPSYFEETDRTEEYIQLYDKDRHLAVRLYGDRGEAYDREEKTWRRWPGSEGKWE